VFARPERLRVVGAGEGVVGGPVTDVVFVGSTTHIRVAVADRELQIVVSNDGDTMVPAPGSTIGVEIPVDAIRVLAR
jgi:ABC-type Fe3+/spermidine/putrescine transport system ATPase subunit